MTQEDSGRQRFMKKLWTNVVIMLLLIIPGGILLGKGVQNCQSGFMLVGSILLTLPGIFMLEVIYEYIMYKKAKQEYQQQAASPQPVNTVQPDASSSAIQAQYSSPYAPPPGSTPYTLTPPRPSAPPEEPTHYTFTSINPSSQPAELRSQYPLPPPPYTSETGFTFSQPGALPSKEYDIPPPYAP